MQGNFVIYKSSAGSGKTYTLVTEYLYLALSSINSGRFKNILALTFTNKAAAEMKGRVIDFLHELSFCDEKEKDNQLLNYMRERLEIPNQEIIKRSERLLSQILHNYSDFAISTIDKFVHRLIRGFSKDLNLSNDFSVELDQQKLLELAVNRLLEEVGVDKNISKVLLEFSKLKAEDDKSWKIEDDLLKIGKMIFDEESIPRIAYLSSLSFEDFELVQQKIAKKKQNFEKQIKAKGDEALALIKANDILGMDMAGGEKSGAFKYFNYLKECRTDKLIPTSTVEKNIENGKWHSGKASVHAKARLDEIGPVLGQYFLQSQKIIEEGFDTYQICLLIQPSVYTMAVLGTLNKILNEIKIELNTIPISDFNNKISEIVLEEPAPFIYEKLGEHYKNFLLDEFQDTSTMQWQNLLPLVENSLGKGNFNLLVGDGKQSIYRFRSGEVEQFEELPNVYNNKNNPNLLEKQTVLQNNFEERVLEYNYRSKKNIVAFNNQFFELLSQKLQGNLAQVYSTITQKTLPKNTGGYLVLRELMNDSDLTQEEEFNESVYAFIEESLEDGYTHKDITVLVRDNKTGSAVANYLLSIDVSVISSESLLLSSNREVQFLVSVLQFITYPSDLDSVVSFLGYLHQAEGNKELLHDWIMEIQNQQEFKNGNSFLVVEKFLKKLNINICFSNIKAFKSYQILEDIISCFNLTKQDNPFIQFFLEAVFNLEQKTNPSLPELLEWWEQKKNLLSIKTPEGADAVTVMTIHKSKGLEFPIVIIPYANWILRPGKRNIWIPLENDLSPLLVSLVPMIKKLESTTAAPFYHEEENKTLLDQINLLYVAFTRPENRLYILTSKNRRNGNSVYTLIKDTIKTFGDWNEEEGYLIIGERSNSQQKDKQNTEKFNLEYPKPGIWYKDAVFGRTADEEDTEGISYGIMMHKILSKTITKEDLNLAIEQVFKENSYPLFNEKDVFDKLNKIIESEKVLPWFNDQNKIRTEVEVLDTGGSLHRLDRTVENNEKITVIDYKTGQEKPSHHDQIMRYGVLMQKMGYKQIELAIVYIDLNEVKTRNFI